MNTNVKILRNAGLAGGSMVGLAILVFLTAPSPTLIKIVSDCFPLFLSFTGTVLAFLLYRRQAKTQWGNRIWGSMTLGLVFWTFGEAIWTFYELVLRRDVPYPSVADIAWAVGYIPLLLSLGYQFQSLRASISRRGKLLIAAFLLAMIVLTAWFVIYPILSSPEAGTPSEIFFSLAYPLEDLVLFSFGTALVLTFLGGQLALPWGAIALGILLLSVSDLLFSYGTWTGLYYPDGRLNFLSGLFDTLYISAYAVWNIGLFLRLRLPETGKDIDAHAFVPGAAAAGHPARAITSVDKGNPPELDIRPDPEARPISAGQDREAVLLGEIVQRAQEQGRDRRISGGEDSLRIYFNALVGLLYVLVSRAGGAGMGAAFEAGINKNARRLGCSLELKGGHILWNEPSTDPGKYQTLLEDAIRYAKSVVSTTTIDQKLHEIESYLAPRVVPAAEENRRRMGRGLGERPH
jgi:hypothetical protein